MSDDKLRVPLTPEESEDCLGTVAISFAISRGRVVVTEHWAGHDEVWSDGAHVTIPMRVWREGLAWLGSRVP